MDQGLAFRILIVEDDEDDRWIIDDAFVELKYAAEVKKFITGQAMFKYLTDIDHSVYPSLIVLDNHLFPTDALDVLKTLKRNPDTKDIPVLIYSGSISPDSSTQLLDAGAIACIEKPAAHEEVLNVARKMREIADSAYNRRQSGSVSSNK